MTRLVQAWPTLMVGHILFYERVSDHTANVIEYLKIARDDTEFTFSHS